MHITTHTVAILPFAPPNIKKTIVQDKIKNRPPIVGVPFLLLCSSTYFKIVCPNLSFLSQGMHIAPLKHVNTNDVKTANTKIFKCLIPDKYSLYNLCRYTRVLYRVFLDIFLHLCLQQVKRRLLRRELLRILSLFHAFAL